MQYLRKNLLGYAVTWAIKSRASGRASPPLSAGGLGTWRTEVGAHLHV
jgi:hypothetical protein